jgi:hypothetical protein
MRGRTDQQSPSCRKKARSQARVGLPLHAIRPQHLHHEQLRVVCRAWSAISPVGAIALDHSIGPERTV